MKVVVTGIKAIDRKLKSIEPAIQKKALRKATRAGAKVLQQEAKANVPVDTGRLKDAIKVRAAKRKKNRILTIVRVGEGDFKGDTFYGGMVEFGTSKTPAQPFMTPAYETRGAEARDVALDEIGRAVDQILRKMSVSGRIAEKIAKSRVLKQARKVATKQAKRARKVATKQAKRARKVATKQAKRARKAVFGKRRTRKT